MAGFSVQLNLLPAVKINYIKAQRQKRYVSFIAVWVAIISAGVVVLLFTVSNVWQKTRLNFLTKDITTQASKLKNTESIDKILTVQSQLNSLESLHKQKPEASRLSTFIPQLVPSDVSLNRLSVDFENNQLELYGQANTLEAVNRFVDTLKFTEYEESGTGTKTKAFKSVVLSTFGRDDKEASYSITVTYEPRLFDNSNDVKLVVPKQTTTRSETERPLFENAPQDEGESQ